MLFQIPDITPFLLALLGGLIAGKYAVRPISYYLCKLDGTLTGAETKEAVFRSIRACSLIIFFVITLISFYKFGVSQNATIHSLYFFYMIFSTMWGISMSAEKRFITLDELLHKIVIR